MSKLSALNKIALPLQATDEIYIIRGANEYSVTPMELYEGFLKFVPGYDGYLIIPASGNTDPDIVQNNDILIGKGAYFGGDYVMMRAIQDSPTLDAHFKTGLRNEEAP